MKQKQLVFKIWQFPHLSETFIISQIITAIKCEFNVKILITELLSVNDINQNELFEKHHLLDKVIIENYKIPNNKIFRLIKWFYLIVANITSIFQIIKFYKQQTSFSLTLLYQFVFYKQFKDTAIFHIQYGTNKSPIDILKKINLLKGSIIVSFHGHDAFFPINGFIPNNGYYNNLFSVASAIVANTPYLAKKIKDLGCNNEILKTIPVGVDTTYFYPLKNSVSNAKLYKLIMVGRLDPVKGHIFGFKTVKLLINKGYNIHLTLIGEGEERANLEEYINVNKLENNISLLGAKSHYEIRELLWQHQLFVFPSVALSNGRRETQGLATIEAQACGLPVVAFDSGGIKYTIDDGKSGYLCNERDYEGLADRIEGFICNLAKYKKARIRAVEFVNYNFSQLTIDKKWEKLYLKLNKNK